MPDVVTVDLEVCGRVFLVRGCRVPTYWNGHTWCPETRQWLVPRGEFSLFRQGQARQAETDWRFTSFAMAAVIEDEVTPDDPSEFFTACVVLGVRTDALECVVHAAYAAVRDIAEYAWSYANAYKLICRERNFEPHELASKYIDDPDAAS